MGSQVTGGDWRSQQPCQYDESNPLVWIGGCQLILFGWVFVVREKISRGHPERGRGGTPASQKVNPEFYPDEFQRIPGWWFQIFLFSSVLGEMIKFFKGVETITGSLFGSQRRGDDLEVWGDFINFLISLTHVPVTGGYLVWVNRL